MKPPSLPQLGRGILFITALGILVYEFIIGPSHGKEPSATIVIGALGLAAATISLKWDLKG